VRDALTNSGSNDPATGGSEADQTVFVSVKDDGQGFDNESVVEGQGLSQSIKGRIVEMGGAVEIDGRQGRGAEIRMWI